MNNKITYEIILFSIFGFLDIAVCDEYFYEYTSKPETWHEASRKCQEKGKNLINVKPDNAQYLNEMLTNKTLWLYMIKLFFWTVHKVKKSSVTRFAESDDDQFPYDNKLADEDDLYCALGVFYPYVEQIRWFAAPCDNLYEYYCTPMFPYHTGSTNVFYDEQTDWDTANRRCQEEGGNLTTLNYIQWVEYSKYFYYNTSEWHSFRHQTFWTRHKTLGNSLKIEQWPITGLDVTRTSHHCVHAFSKGPNTFWTTDDCGSLHSFICEMPAPTENFYFFFEMPNLTVKNNQLLKTISFSLATPQECADICREENAQNLECTGFEVNHSSGTCTTHVQYFTDPQNDELFQINRAEWSNDTSVYDLHYIKEILRNKAKKSSTVFPSTQSIPSEITTSASDDNRKLETKQSTTFYQSSGSKSTDDNVTDSTVSVNKVNSTMNSNIPFWLLSGFGAVSTIVATTWLGIIIKRSNDRQKIYPAEQETSNESFESNPFPSGDLRSF